MGSVVFFGFGEYGLCIHWTTSGSIVSFFFFCHTFFCLSRILLMTSYINCQNKCFSWIYLCTVVVAVVFFLLLSIVITSVALYYRLLYYWIRLKIDLENKHFEEVELYHEPCAKSVKKVKQERKKRGLCYSKRNWEKEIIITLNVMMIFFLIYLKYKFYILKWKKNNYCSFS